MTTTMIDGPRAQTKTANAAELRTGWALGARRLDTVDAIDGGGIKVEATTKQQCN